MKDTVTGSPACIAHGTTLRPESAQPVEILAFAFRKVGKREVTAASVSTVRTATPRIVIRTPATGAPVWSTMAPTTSLDCADAEATTQTSIRVATSNFYGSRQDLCIFLRREDTWWAPYCASCKAGAVRRFPRVVLTGLLVLGAVASAAAQSVQKQVLVLQSVDRGNLVVDHFTTNSHVELDQRAEQPVNFVQVVGPIGPVGAPERAIVDFIVSTFADGPPDLIVTVSAPPRSFARKHRQQLFPETPPCSRPSTSAISRAAPLGENETAVASANDFPRLIDDILQVLPKTRQVFVVAGTGQLGQFWHKELAEPFSISRSA